MATRQTSTPRQLAGSAAVQQRMKVRFRMFREIGSELKKVVWPTREETTNLTVIVVVVSVAVGLLLGAADQVFYLVINRLILGQ